MEQALKTSVLSLKSISRNFYQGSRKISVLDGADLDLAPRECIALVGPSGAGNLSMCSHHFLNAGGAASINETKTDILDMAVSLLFIICFTNKYSTSSSLHKNTAVFEMKLYEMYIR